MPHPSTDRSLEERVERLERAVAELQAQLAREPSRIALRRAPRSRAPWLNPGAWEHQSEQWLGRVGLGLLFLGLVYLFNYSVEQGWITPAVRVGVGLAIGSVLLALGLRLQHGRRSYSQLLLAGAIAVYYVSGFAAFQLYALVSHSAAFAYMAGVMALAVALARKQDRPALASLGAMGGFLTPLLLHPAPGRVVELAVYSALVVGWAGGLFWLRGWPSLLWTYAAGGLAALGFAAHQAAGGERPVVQAALGLTWLLGAALPFARGILRPDARQGLRRSWGLVPAALQLRALGVGVTSAALLFTDRLWALSDEATGALFFCFALLYSGAAAHGVRDGNRTARAAAPVAAALLAAATLLLLDDAALVAALAVQACAFVYAGSHARLRGVEWVGHPLFAMLGLFFALEAFATGVHRAFDSVAMAQLAQIACLVAAAGYAHPRPARWTYLVAAHALLLAWLAKELDATTLGTGAITLAWGAYGAALLVGALRWRDRRAAATLGLQLIAFSALALAVLKLVLVDLSRVAMLWRVLLFLGFGTALLALSSLFKARASDPPGEGRAAGP